MIYVLSAGRVIGIVVLVIVIVLAVMLFFPVTYRFDADLDNRRVKLKVYWLFRLLRFRFGFEEELELALAFLVFEIDFLDEERRERRRLRRKGRQREKIEEVERSTRERLVLAARTFAHVVATMRENQVLGEAWPLLWAFLLRMRPRDFHGCIEFGMSDPARTGQITGAVAAIPMIYASDLSVVPDFDTEKTYIRGDVHAKGRVLMLHVLILAVRMIRNERIRMFVRGLRGRE